LATGSTSATLFVIAGAVAFILAGLASVRFARN
jgi:LPXTG-motif cell wall-anchored protein